MSKVMKIRLVRAGFHAAGETDRQRDRHDRQTDRQTDRHDKPFRNFANSPKKKRKIKGRKMDVIMCLILVSFFVVKYNCCLWPLHQAMFKIYDSTTYSMWLVPLSIQ